MIPLTLICYKCEIFYVEGGRRHKCSHPCWLCLAETLLRKNYVSYKCFPVCPSRETLLRKNNLLPRMQKSHQIQKHFCCGNNFSQFAHMFSNVSNTRNIVFPIGHVQTMFKDYSANINNTLRFVRANVSQKYFLVCPRWET